jgi:RNA polymerase sigma-70 factor (ECF subfamily)
VSTVADHDGRTSTTLLKRLRETPSDPRAWQDFVGRYLPGILTWASHWTRQPADAEDVAQEVLTRLFQKLKAFEYDRSRSFTGWLRWFTRGVWSDVWRRHRRAGVAAGGSEFWARVEQEPAAADLVERLKGVFDLELLEQAQDRVRGRVEERTWQAYSLSKLESLPAAEVAARLEMGVDTVYAYCHRVLRLLQEELRRLEEGPPD